MKRIIAIRLIAVVIVAFAIGCGDSAHYVLKGEIDRRYDGHQVMLTPATFFFQKQKPIPVDSAIIRNGSFEFKGVVGTEPIVYTLMVEGMREIKLSAVPVIMEAGKIEVVYDSLTVKLSGTPMNERYDQTIGEGLRLMSRKQQELMNERMEMQQFGRMSAHEIGEWYSQSYRLAYKQLVVDATKRFVRECVGTPVGDYFYFQYMGGGYSQSFIDSVYPKIRCDLRQQYELEMKERWDKQERFAASQLAMKEGNVYRDIVGETIDGKAVCLSELVGKGKVVCVEFWASWCVPCIRDMFPLLKDLHARYEEKGLVTLGISLDNDRGKWEKILKIHQPVGIQISDLQGWEKSPARYDYGVQAVPFTIVIDENGKIVARNAQGEKLVQVIEQYLGVK